MNSWKFKKQGFILLIFCLFFSSIVAANEYQLWNSISDVPDVEIDQDISDEIIYFQESEVTAEIKIEGLGDPFSRQKPIDFIFIIDVSGSMGGSPITNVKEASALIVEQLGEQDRGAVIPFASSARVSQPFTGDEGDIMDAVNALSAGGGTDIADGIKTTIDLCLSEARPESVKIAILLSDGKSSFNPAIARAYDSKEEDILIYTLGIGSGVDQDLLAEIADITGGTFYFSPDEEEINEFMTQLGEEIFNSSGRDLRLQVTIPDQESVVLKNVNHEPLMMVYKEDGTAVLNYCYETFFMGEKEKIVLEYFAYNLEPGEYHLTETTLLSYQNIDNEYQQKELPGLSFQVKEKPELAAFGNQAVYENRLLELNTVVGDSFARPLEYKVDNLPEGAEFNTETGFLKWVPDFDKSGIYENVKFSVTDGTFVDSEKIDITVFNNNRRPKIDPIENIKVTEGESIEIEISVQDPDGDQLLCSAGNLPPGAEFDSNTFLFTWNTEVGQAGEYEEISFYVTDGKLMNKESILIKVDRADNEPPTSYIYLEGEKWWDGWFKSSVKVTLEAEDNPGGSGVSAIYYKMDGEDSYRTYKNPFIIEKNGITTVTVYAEDRAGNQEQPHSKDVKISRPWTLPPYAVLCQELGNYGEVCVDNLFSNGSVEIYGNLSFNYLGTSEESIIQAGEIVINELDLNAPIKELPVPDWEALKEKTELRNESSLREVELSDVRFENDIQIYGKSKIKGQLVVEGDLYIYDQPVMKDAGIFCTGDVIIAGNVEMDGFIYTGGDLVWYGQPKYSGAIIVDGKFNAAGNIKNDEIAVCKYLKWLKRVDFSY